MPVAPTPGVTTENVSGTPGGTVVPLGPPWLALVVMVLAGVLCPESGACAHLHQTLSWALTYVTLRALLKKVGVILIPLNKADAPEF